MNGHTALVVLAHVASYADPIRLLKGDAIVLSGRSDIWDGHRWLWAIAPDGREGWIPDDLPIERSGWVSADRDYSAVELSCVLDETMQVVEVHHGWVWCCNGTGAQGWVPHANLEMQGHAPEPG